MNATEYHFSALHISKLCQAVWDEQPIRKKVFPASLVWLAFPPMLQTRCRVLHMRSSERTERDNSGTVVVLSCCIWKAIFWTGSSAMYPKMPFYEGGKLACESE